MTMNCDYDSVVSVILLLIIFFAKNTGAIVLLVVKMAAPLSYKGEILSIRKCLFMLNSFGILLQPKVFKLDARVVRASHAMQL